MWTGNSVDGGGESLWKHYKSTYDIQGETNQVPMHPKYVHWRPIEVDGETIFRQSVSFLYSVRLPRENKFKLEIYPRYYE